MSTKLTIVVPIFNELENLEVLYKRIIASMERPIFSEWEAILVNDGSDDGSAAFIDDLSRKDSRFKTIHFESNCGQSAAFDAGFRHATYPLVGTLDADLQNDPFDFEVLLSALQDGVGAVCGVRANRQDSRRKIFASKVANRIRNKVTHESISDTGCSLKVFRREALRKIKLFDGMHRFLPTLIRMEGYAVKEIPVGHHPRFAGSSKYSTFKRGWPALLDLLAVRWMQKRRLNYQVTRRTNLLDSNLCDHEQRNKISLH